MLSRQLRVVIGFVAATVLLMLLAYRNGYDIDRISRIASPSAEHETSLNEPPASSIEEEHGGTKSDQVDGPVSQASAPPPTPDSMDSSPFQEPIDWKRFAYVQYVTDAIYLCNAAIVFETLHKLGSQADRVMMYPAHMLDDPKMPESKRPSSKLLIKVRDEYDVKLVPIEVQHRDNTEDTWGDSYTKLLAFNQTQYDRIIAFDSDALLLQIMDELFFMPPCPIAMPRAYWLMKDTPPKKILSTHIMLLTPSDIEFKRVQNLIDHAKNDDFDMEIINDLYGDSAAVLPHRPYALLTGEFRSNDHKWYLGSDVEEWDPQAIFEETKLVHFSDWPVPKPWVQDDALRGKHQPECKHAEGEEEDCLNRDIWNSLYAEFTKRRKNVCV